MYEVDKLTEKTQKSKKKKSQDVLQNPKAPLCKPDTHRVEDSTKSRRSRKEREASDESVTLIPAPSYSLRY
jgi:Zn-dependent M16 (insulinase) family peptidase